MDLTYIERWLSDATVNYKDGRPAVGLGLIITVFFRNGHTTEVREKMVGCVDRFYEEFKPHLKRTITKKWSGITESNLTNKRKEILASTPEEIFSWYLTSASEEYLAPEYSILIMGERIFHNDTSRSVIKLTFPIDFLKESTDLEIFQSWLLELSSVLPVESGYAGLSFSLPYERQRLFPYEYALAQRFPGVMVDSIGTLEGGHAVTGIKGACWFTILGTPWVEKLGGEAVIKQLISDTPEIGVLPYSNGLILKAGDLPPALGEVNTEELPPLLVKVNQVIKPVRLQKERSLHFYSMEENHQFDENSTAKWYARLDAASDKLPLPDMSPREPERITAFSGEISPHTGRWGTFIDGSLRYVHLKQGQKLPGYEDKEGKLHRTLWSLLERDDKDNIFVNRQ